MNRIENKLMEIKNLSVLQKAAANADSLEKHLEFHHIDAKEKAAGNTLLHQAVDSLAIAWEKSSGHIGASAENKTKNNFNSRIIKGLIVQGASPYIKNKNGQRVIESQIFQSWINHIVETYKPDPSKKTYYVYLAGPEVFLTFNLAAGNFIKAQTLLFNTHHLQSAPYNIEGFYPFDSGYTPKKMDFQDGINIYKGDVDLMNQSQAIMANMVKFRGPGMDGGTAYEMGYMTAQKKVIVGYYDERPYFNNYKTNRSYTEKVEEEVGKVTKKGTLNLNYDKDNLLVEPFKMPDNLMMVVPTLTPDGNLNIPDSSWKALFCLKEKLDAL